MKNNNIFSKKKFYLFIFIFGIIILGNEREVFAKSEIFEKTDSTTRNVAVPNGPYTISNLSLKATYNMEVTGTDTGSVINEGSSIACGECLTFRFRPAGLAIPNSGETPTAYNNSWVITGNGNDSPYGEWVSNFSTLPAMFQGADYIEKSTAIDKERTIYMPFKIKIADATLTNYTGKMTCGNKIFDGNGIFHYDCETITKTGSFTPRFFVPATPSRLYYNYKYKYKVCSGTTCNWIDQNSTASTFIVEEYFPSKNIDYTLNAIGSSYEEDASCGPAAKTYAYTDTAYSGTFCATGEAPITNPSFPAASSSVSWICSGIACGASPTCTASRAAAPINGSCGTATNGSVSKPTTNLCVTGTQTTVLGTGPWNWSCTGSNGGTTAVCVAPTIIGSCGTAINGSASIPTTNLCASGTPTAVLGTGPWTWTCTGFTTATCVAPKIISAAGSCGTATTTAVYVAPTTNLCTYTSSSTTLVSENSASFNWTCYGSNTPVVNVSCSAPKKIDGACGSANDTTVTSEPTTNLCTVTATTPTVTGTGPWNWTCTGFNGGTTDSCSAQKSAGTVINGDCGVSDNMQFSSTPTTNLCNVTATTPTVNGAIGSLWQWECTGSGTGATNDSCDAERSCIGPPPSNIEIANDGVYTYYDDVDVNGDCDSELRSCDNGDLSGSYTNISCGPGGGIGGLNPVCKAYQDLVPGEDYEESTGNIIVNKIMEWRVTGLSDTTTYTYPSIFGESFRRDGYIYFPRLYQTLGIKNINNLSFLDPLTGKSGSCSASVNVVLGDQIIIEQ